MHLRRSHFLPLGSALIVLLITTAPTRFSPAPITSYDWGDLPDPTYATSAISGGPSHEIVTGVHMGQSIDGESDGQPHHLALGDDYDAQGDDDDGVLFAGPVLVGLTRPPTPVSVTVTTSGYLSAWVDFNGDGTLDDTIGSPEKVFDAVSVIAGANTLAILSPAEARHYTIGPSFARFRFTKTSGEIPPTGLVVGGEVEDYAIQISAEGIGYEFGDLPDGDLPGQDYPTLLANDGARHIIWNSIQLEYDTNIQGELDGKPNATATGDDNDGHDDEDGVLYSGLRAGETGHIQVYAGEEALLNAWMDFNNDGDFEDTGEHVFSDLALNIGENRLTTLIPTVVPSRGVYARFRYSTQAGIGPSGWAADGEVEDYLLDVEPPLLDYGDLPDQPYATWLNSDGPRHMILEGVHLGSSIDGDSDGQPHSEAIGDDNDGTDDEDGVGHWPSYMIGTNETLSITTSAAGFFSWWADHNHDGDFEDDEEAMVINSVVPEARSWFPFYDVPLFALPGPTAHRFRFSSEPVSLPTGVAEDGEVEDYMINVVPLDADFGDLPDQPYQTTLANDGAYHVLDGVTMFGATVEADPDGQPGTDALGDDTDGSDDEDGVEHLNPYVPGMFSGLKISYSSGPKFVKGWIDLDQDNSFAGDLEIDHQFTGSMQLTSVIIPDDATGTIYERYRISTHDFDNYYGYARDGEVEDYAVQVHEIAYDYGDAPDSYGTTAGSIGAHHIATPYFSLGSNIFDANWDGMPTVEADGDDNSDGIDDETAVIFPWNGMLPICVDSGLKIEVQVYSGFTSEFPNAYLDAWIDFDRNGVFDESDRIINASDLSTITSSSRTYQEWIPCLENVSTGDTYARFRLSETGGLPPTGFGGPGEVEDYKIRLLELDYGDLPESFTGAEDWFYGAHHGILEQCHLGNGVDAEEGSQPDFYAIGDDDTATGTDDEDGIVFLATPFIAGTTASMQVTAVVDGCPEPAQLYCWADFNANGTFGELGLDEPGEYIVPGYPLTTGSFPVNFPIPAEYSDEDIYVRCRMSTDYPTYGWSGWAPNGEVEDYWVPYDFLATDISSFDAIAVAREVNLTWKTESETGLAGFSVRKVLGDSRYEEVGFVEAEGSSQSGAVYEFGIRNSEFGRHRYRLVTLDLDGSENAGPEVEVLVEMTEHLLLEPAYPNPFNPSTLVRFAVKEAGQTSLALYSMDGKKVRQVYDGTPAAGTTQTVRVDGSGLPSGVYVLRLETAEQVVDRTVTLVR